MKYSLLSGGAILSLWQQLFIVFCGSAASFQKFQKYHKSSWDTSLLSAVFFWVTTETSKKKKEEKSIMQWMEFDLVSW